MLPNVTELVITVVESIYRNIGEENEKKLNYSYFANAEYFFHIC